QLRLLGEVGKVFGGFFWAVDTDEQVVIVSIPPQTASFRASADSLTNTDQIMSITVTGKNGKELFTWRQKGQDAVPLTKAYQLAHAGDTLTYTIQHSNNTREQTMLPAVQFSWNMWLENYGLAFVAGFSWLFIGTILLM